jgi:hypothetical protein
LVLIRRLGRYFRPYWGRIVFSMACMGVVGATLGTMAAAMLAALFLR